MTHMVIFRSPDGKPGYHQADGLDDAVRFVEHLRNDEQVTDSRIFQMAEIPIEFKTYYRVEVASPHVVATDSGSAAAEQAVAAGSEGSSPEVGEPVMADAVGGSRFGRFNRA